MEQSLVGYDELQPAFLRQRNERIISRYRAGEAIPGIVILTTIGIRSGLPHATPVCFQVDGDRLIVAGSVGGLPRHPQWYRNLVANPALTVEARGDCYEARATTVPNGLERDKLFARMNEVIPGLYGYQDRAADDRQIPIVAIEQIAAVPPK
jgi:deazaflavin-dependent oxidoreductase (nitroreductase family)